MVLSNTGEVEAALTFLNRALILAPDYVEAAYNAGVILEELGSLADAETVFRRALAAPAALVTRGVRVSAHLRLLHVLSIQGRQEEWISEGQRFVKTYPDLARSRLIESRLERHHGNVEQEAKILLPLAEAATLLEDDTSALDLISELLLTLSFQDVPARLLQRLQTRFADATRALYPPLDDHSNSNSGRALQVGYLVDFFQPFVADFINMMVAHHDFTRVNVKVYAISPAGADIVNALAAYGIPLTSIATLDERRAARRIMSDCLDVLVDVATFGPFAKPGVLSCRPARVQVTLPGFTRPSGIGELDFRLSDRASDLNDEPEPGTIRPLILEGCVFPVLPAAQPRPQLARSQFGIGDGVPVFGVLASADRVSARCVTIWKALSETVPAAVFLVCPLQPSDSETVMRLLSVGGIDASRILMMPASMPRPRDLCLTGMVDIILDTMPGSDYFSARAAILDSIPLITMSGRMPQERVATSLLTQLGDVSTVAHSGRDYVELACQIAQDCSAAAMRTARLNELLQESLMLNMGEYVKHFEDALLRAAATPECAERSS
jgi:predicted O-linked N-acetylglucosamine transferase (SPINDLY family)